MMFVKPERRHVYQNHHLDSTRWDYVVHRPGDIVVSTSYKAGTTLMQTIVANLLYPNDDVPMPVVKLSPWVDRRYFPLELVLNQLAGERARRFIKTHLPLDGLPYRDDVQYLVVGRDPRDVFVSLLNHWEHYTPEQYATMNGTPGRVGDPFPEFPRDVARCWHDWITRGWFPWESDGYPFWSHLHHCRTWWEFRHLPNILFVHYADLRADLDGEMRRIADWLEIAVPAARWPHVVDACRFETVKRNPEKVVGDLDHLFAGGAQTFITRARTAAGAMSSPTMTSRSTRRPWRVRCRPTVRAGSSTAGGSWAETARQGRRRGAFLRSVRLGQAGLSVARGLWPPAFLGDLHYYLNEYDITERASEIDTSRVAVHASTTTAAAPCRL